MSIATLENLGLRNQEAKVYIALLRNGPSSVFKAAKHAAIPRSTAYEALAALEERQLVGSLRRNRVIYYEALSPVNLIEEMETKLSLARMIVPLLEAQQRAGGARNSNDVRFFHGRRGVRGAFVEFYERVAKEGLRNIQTISDPDFEKELPGLLKEVIGEKVRRNIHSSLITSGSARRKRFKFYQDDEFRTVRYFPDRITFRCTMIVGGSSTLFVPHGTLLPLAIVIESEQIGDMFRQFFQFFWEMLE